MGLDEVVMCVPREWVQKVLGVSKLQDTVYFEDVGLHNLAALTSKEHVEWIERRRCENDPQYKQIIPYIIVRCFDTAMMEYEYLIYNRTKVSGEERLIGKASFGIGGHVSRPESVREALIRELEEELETNKEMFDLSFYGFVNNESDDVGKVHLGALFVIDFSITVRPTLKCESLASPRWLTERDILTLNSDEFEVWSQLFIKDYIEE